MAKKQKIESWQQLVADFKPQKPKTEVQVIREYLKTKNIDYDAKYRACGMSKFSYEDAEGKMWIRCNCDVYTKGFPSQKQVFEFDSRPEDWNYSKDCSILYSIQESGVLNLKTRRAEDGIFIFKITVHTSEPMIWLFFHKGKVCYISLKPLVPFISFYGDSNLEVKEMSDFKKQYPSRVLIPTGEAIELRKKGLLHFVIDAKRGEMIASLSQM